MDDADLKKLLDQDERFDRAFDAADGDTNLNAETLADEGLRILHRIRRERSDWPLGDPQLEEPQVDQAEENAELEWGAAGLPQSLGRFKIQRELGRGGFGIVLQAHDPKLQQDVALKLPRAESLLSDEARERMAREARAATILAHPAIVPVYEVGNLAAVTYISYGLCRGDSLADWMADRPVGITPVTAAKIVARLAEAIQHAHARQVVHRDLKPSNILFERTFTDANGDLIDALRISDFGLAKLTTARSDISRTGAPLGTPAYMSPEQVRGDADVGGASDIFSLGVVLYELLTGTVPFRRETDIATMRAIETAPLTPVRSLNKTVPKDLAAICEKCLEKRAADRYDTAQALSDDLQAFLTDQPVSARPVGVAVRALRWSRRNPALFASLAASILVLVAATIVSTAMWQREQAARTLSELNEQRAAVAGEEARQQAGALQNILANLLSDLTRVPSDDVQALTPLLNRLLDSYHEQIQQQDSADPAIQENHFRTLEQLASIHRNLGDNRKAAAIFEEARDYCQQQRPEEFGRQAYFLGLMSGELRAVGELERATELARESVDIQRRAVAEGTGPRCTKQLLIAYLANLCEIVDDDNPDEAELYIDEAIELAADQIGKPPSDWPPRRFWNALLNNKVKVCALLGELDEARHYAEIGLRNVQALMPNDRSYSLNQLAGIHRSLAHVNSAQEKYKVAAEHYLQAIECAEELAERHPQLGIVHSIVPPIVNEYAAALVAQGELDEAQRLVDENLQRVKAGRERFSHMELEWNEIEARANSLIRAD